MNGDVYLIHKQVEHLDAVDSLSKLLQNDLGYKPFRATVLGPGGTRTKSFIINPIMSIISTESFYPPAKVQHGAQ